MIKKYLIYGKQIFLSSKRHDEGESRKVIELSMPLQIFWDVEKLLKEAEYMISTNEDQVVLNSKYFQILKTVLPCVVYEKDRVWLNDRVNRDS